MARGTAWTVAIALVPLPAADAEPARRSVSIAHGHRGDPQRAVPAAEVVG